jgi:hypothetical protein
MSLIPNHSNKLRFYQFILCGAENMVSRYLKNKMMRMLSSSLHNELLIKDIARLEIEKTLLKAEAEKAEVEKRLLKAEAEVEKTVLKAEAEVEKTLLKAEVEKTLLKAENNLLKIEVKERNWDLLKVHEQLHLRTFLILFRNRHINSQPGKTFEEKLTTFLSSRKESLNDWKLNEKLFVESLSIFYNRLNKNAHPEFIFRDCLDIPVNMFSKTEFQLLGFLWENWPLPLKKFKIRYAQSGPVSIETLKRQKD